MFQKKRERDGRKTLVNGRKKKNGTNSVAWNSWTSRGAYTLANIRGEWKSYGYGGSLEGNANWEIQWLLCRGEEGAYEIHDAKINGSEGSLAPSVAPLPPSHSISLRLSYSKCLLLLIQVLFT